jgi:hypothetical protein
VQHCGDCTIDSGSLVVGGKNKTFLSFINKKKALDLPLSVLITMNPHWSLELD